jgi:molybdopterin converting factor small subunit
MKRTSGKITIELYGLARLRAGCARVDVFADDLAGALGALVQRCPALEPEVIREGLLRESFLASRNGERFLPDAATPLSAGDTVLILSAQAGG